MTFFFLLILQFKFHYSIIKDNNEVGVLLEGKQEVKISISEARFI